jgi:polyisoprenoid-binding protein YceI
MRKRFLFAALIFLPALHAQENSWTIAPLDSFANFTVKHLMMSSVHGSMGGMKGTVIYDPKDPSKDSVEATLDVATLNTGTSGRDDELKANYFDAKTFPTITFKSTKIVQVGKGKLRMTGNLTMKGTTRTVVLDVEGPSPPVKDAQGRLKSAVVATTKISRKDYGIIGTKLDTALEGGGIIVSDEVALELDIEMTPTAAPAPASH